MGSRIHDRPHLILRAVLLALCLLPMAAHAQVRSLLSVYDLDTGEVRTIYSARAHFEAPNWSADGLYLIINQEGRLYRVSVFGGEPELIPTGDLADLNNDHGVSPDGKQLVVSSQDGHIYVLPATGGTPRRVTTHTPSWWHGWSPDGKELAYVGLRDDRFDLYVIPVEGGEERALTADDAHDDGPDYSPDGRWIYWNSDRSGNFDVWRIPARGGEAEQITDDAFEDWFPHPSPDGEHLVVLSYEPGTEGHPANQPVRLRLMTPEGADIREVAKFIGGQGTINVPSWSPDGRSFAFVRYRVLGE